LPPSRKVPESLSENEASQRRATGENPKLDG